nr:response regulator transcription factor [Clostridium yunnanense]
MYKNSSYKGIIGITYGVALFHLGKYEKSLEVFKDVAFLSRKNRAGYSLVYSLLWKAIVLDKLQTSGNRELINILREAVFYCREEEILFPYYINKKLLNKIFKKFNEQLVEDKDNRTFLKKLESIVEWASENTLILSSREIEVLRALIEGLSNKEIGEKLFISVSTVKTHIINIYSKLGVKNRVEAVNEGVKILQ